MPVCRYFLQGTCRFGNACKFDHQIDVSTSNFLGQTGIPPSYQGFQQQPQLQTKPQQNVDDQTLIKSAANDMIAAEKGGQWILSCYAPFKERAAFPGFSDVSFEEARYSYYEAVQNGTVENYKQEFQKMLQTAMAQIKAIQSPNANVINILKAIYNNQPLPSTDTAFGQQQQQQQQQQSAFNNQSIFNQQQPSNQSIFANQNNQTSSNQFSFINPPGNQGNQSMFAKQPTISQPNQSLLLNQPPSQAMDQNQSPFTNQSVGQSNQPLFVNQQLNPSQQNQSLFANQQSIPNQQNQSLFANQQQLMMGQLNQPQPSNQSVFQSQITQNNQRNQSVLFTNNNNQQKQMDITDDNYYSKLEDLTKEEIDWFENDDNLNIDEIPLKPPTKEMCFRK